MINSSSANWGELEILSLFRSPFLIPSLLFHGMLVFLAMWTTSLTLPNPESSTPISVQLLDVRDGNSVNRSIGPGIGPGGPKTTPKLGSQVAPAQQTGKLTGGSTESTVPSNDAVETAPPPKPIALPGPKVLATDSRPESVSIKETSPDSLVRLPTKESATHLSTNAAADMEAHQKSLAALKGVGEGPGIKALKEGPQVPGALKAGGIGAGPLGVPGGNRSGTGIAGGGTGTGSGGGSTTGLKGISNAEYNQYLNQLKKRVESVWKYPDNVTGVQKVAIRFALDRAGKLTLSEVLESTDSRINASALEAIRRASPFPAIPESLKDLANEPLIIRFEVAIRVRG
jgi:TonB family protein